MSKNDESGIIAKFVCWVLGHNLMYEGEFDNGASRWGAEKCSRCGFNHLWQNDYGTVPGEQTLVRKP